jgi:hypothetical protein
VLDKKAFGHVGGCGASGRADSNWREYLHIRSTYPGAKCATGR